MFCAYCHVVLFVLSWIFAHSWFQTLGFLMSDIMSLREGFWGPVDERAPTTKERRQKLFELFESHHDPLNSIKFNYGIPLPIRKVSSIRGNSYRLVYSNIPVCENFYFHCLGLSLHTQVRNVKQHVINGEFICTMRIFSLPPTLCVFISVTSSYFRFTA